MRRPWPDEPTSLYAEWGRRIRRARKGRDLTQVELAGLINVSQQALSRWEHGECAPADGRRFDLAAALGIPINDLFSYDIAEPNGDEAAA